MKLQKKIVDRLEFLAALLFFRGSNFFHSSKKNDECYLFLAINGAGLGHLTRCLAIAKKIKREKPDAEIIFFTTSLAVQLVHQHGFLCHHTPPFNLNSNLSSRVWNIFFAKSLQEIVLLHKPGTIIFDGTYIYRGLQEVIKKYGSLKYVWIKRGSAKDTAFASRLESMEALFSTVIIPGEVGSTEETRLANTYEVAPVILCDHSELLSRVNAREALGLPNKKKIIYLQLGAGNINDITNLEKRIMNTISKMDGYQLVIGRSPISLKRFNPAASGQIVNYPNSIYFRAFDVVVSACGYNSVAELLYLGIPSILFPNKSTVTDDQEQRASLASRLPYIKTMMVFESTIFAKYLDELSAVKATIPENFQNGAVDAAEAIINVQ